MEGANNPGTLLLVTVAKLVIQLSSFACAKNNGDNLRHNDFTSKDATHLNVVDSVTSFLTSSGTVPDTKSRVIPENVHGTIPDRIHGDIPEKVQRAIPERTLLTIPDTYFRTIPKRLRRAIPDRIQRAIPDRISRAIPNKFQRVHSVILDRRCRVVPERKRRGVPDTNSRAIPYRHRRATKPCTVDCSRVKHKPVCGTDRQTYRHKCELKRIRRCEGRRVRAVPMGFCTGNHGNSSLTAQLLF